MNNFIDEIVTFLHISDRVVKGRIYIKTIWYLWVATHFYAVFIAFKISGVIASIVTALIPFSEFYWVVVADEQKFQPFFLMYAILPVMLIVKWVVSFLYVKMLFWQIKRLSRIEW